MTSDDVLDILTLVKLSGVLRAENVVLNCPFSAVSGHRNKEDRHPSLGILPVEDDAVWNCFACGRRGKTLESFLLKLEHELHIDTSAANARLKSLLVVDPVTVAESIPAWDSHFHRKEGDDYSVFPDSWTAPYYGKVPRYILNRGVRLETLKKFEVGYDKDRERVFYTVRDLHKKLVGAVGGLIYKSERLPKYINYWHRIHATCGWPLEHSGSSYRCPSCGVSPVGSEHIKHGFKKSNFLYGEWLVPEDCIPVLVEGPVDALVVQQAIDAMKPSKPFCAVALFGSKPSAAQVEKLIEFSTRREVYVWMDDDLAGKDGQREIQKMLRRRVRVFRPEYPRPGEGQDPGSLKILEVMRSLRGAKIVL